MMVLSHYDELIKRQKRAWRWFQIKLRIRVSPPNKGENKRYNISKRGAHMITVLFVGKYVVKICNN